jgi:hypothetical protein
MDTDTDTDTSLYICSRRSAEFLLQVEGLLGCQRPFVATVLLLTDSLVYPRSPSRFLVHAGTVLSV